MNPWIKKALIAIVVLAFAALLIFSFQKNFEYVEKTQWQPLSGEAKSNPLYASKLFLRRMGIPTETVESLQNLTTLPDTDTVILISSSRQTLREAQLLDLLTWVRNGGHLVISGIADWNMFSASSSIVDEADDGSTEGHLEDTPIYYDESEEEFRVAATGDALQDFLNVEIHGGIQFEDEKPQAIKFEGAARALEIGPDYYRAIVLNDENEKIGLEQVAINGKNIIIRQQVDEGLITLVSDFDFINNYKIGKFDHAEILWQIVRGKPATLKQSSLTLPKAVWLIHSDETANLFEVIWKYFWPLVTTLALLLLIWILRVSRRFGPLIAKETEDRRNLLEHIDASGAYYWEQHKQAMLLESNRSATQQLLAKRIPGWQALSQQDQIQLLAKRIAIGEPSLLKALYGNISTSAYEFTDTIKQLEHIRTHI